MNSNQSKYAPYILFVAITCVSTAAIFIRFAQETLPSITIAAYRLVFASLILFPFTIKKTLMDLKGLNKKSIGLILVSAFLLAFHFASWIQSLEYTNVISSVVLVTTTPIWVAAISPWLLKESVPKRFFLGLMIAFIGIVLINFKGALPLGEIDNNEILIVQNRAAFGNFLALVGALCAAGYVVVGRILRKQLSTESYVLSVYSVAGLILFSITIITNTQIKFINITELKWLLLIALIPQVVGHSLLNWSLGSLPAHFVAISLLGEPIGSSILAIFFLSEMPLPGQVISSMVILFGIIVALTRSKNHHPLKFD